MFKSIALVAALALGCFASANADPLISGGIGVAGGNPTITTNAVYFDGIPGVVTSTSGSFDTASFGIDLEGTAVYLQDFYDTPGYTYSAPGLDLIHGDNFDFFLTSILTNTTSNGVITITGTGDLTATGFDETAANFTFSTSEANGAISYEITSGSNPVPEPASLALFGTGLLGIVGVARRKFNV